MTPNKERALAALLTHRTRKEAAAAAGLTDRTLRSYFNDPEFQQAYRKAFFAMVEDAARQSQQSLTPALSTLHDIMNDDSANPAARIQAAKNIIDCALKLTEQQDIIMRLEALERLTDKN